MIEYNMYDMTNVKKFCGDDISKEFRFEKNFIKKTAEDFINELEKKQS